MENLTKADSRLLPGFGPGEGIVSGQAVRFPLVIKVNFDSRLVTRAIGDEDFLKELHSWSESPTTEATRVSEDLEKGLEEISDKA